MRRTGRFSQQRKELWCGQYGVLLFLWLTLIYSEWLVRSATISAAFWRAGLWLSVLFAFPPALAVFVLSAQFRKRGNRAVVLAFQRVGGSVGPWDCLCPGCEVDGDGRRRLRRIGFARAFRTRSHTDGSGRDRDYSDAGDYGTPAGHQSQCAGA